MDETKEKLYIKEKFDKLLEKYTYSYVKANTKSKKNILVDDLLSISRICNDYLSEFNFKLPWNENELYGNYVIYLYKYIYNLINNRDMYLDIFNSSISGILDNATFDPYKYYGKFYQRHSEKELDTIFCDFLSDFDNDIYKIYIDLIDRGNIFFVPLSGYNGIQHTFSLIKDNMIFINNMYDDNIELYRVLSHELGHVIEANLYLNSGNFRQLNNGFNSSFYEVSSSFMEYAYINYLIENDIYNKENRTLFYDYIKELLLNSIYASVICRSSNIEYRFDNELDINVNDFDSYFSDIEDKYNIYDVKKDKVSLKNSFVYGFGQLFSVYLYENYKKDPEYFKKEFNKALLEYSMTENMSSFARVGINYDELVKGDILKKVLARNS